MKSVLISIQPKWCELIANGKKTVEVRKTKPKIDVPFKCYIYETNGIVPVLGKSNEHWQHLVLGKGKIIGEFICRNIDEYDPVEAHTGAIYWLDDRAFESTGFENLEDLCEYGGGKRLFGWNISELVIYDQPKKLREFRHCSANYHHNPTVTKAPQSWCYVEEVQQPVEFYKSERGVTDGKETVKKSCL